MSGRPARPAAPDARARQRWLRQLATLLEAGISLQQALPLLSLQRKAGERAWWLPVTRDLEQGLPLSEALARRQACPTADIAQVAAAERTGDLGRQLGRLAGRQARRLQLQAGIRRTLRYPGLVLAGALGVTGFLLIRVVPGFAELYQGFDAELPTLTRQLLAVSRAMQEQAVPILLLLTTLPVLMWLAWRRHPGWRRLLQRVFWHCPGIGPACRAHWLGLWHRAVADMMAAGLPYLEALAAASDLVGESPLAPCQTGLRNAVANGERLSRALAGNPRYPPQCAQMIAIGEESGMLATLLHELAQQFEQELETRCEQMLKLLEPALMAGLGLLVGFMVMALYMPLFQLGQVMQ